MAVLEAIKLTKVYGESNNSDNAELIDNKILMNLQPTMDFGIFPKKEKKSSGLNTTRALNGVDMVVAEGEFLGVMGPSGSGKTTLLNIMCGLDKATSGVLRLEGTDMAVYDKDDLALLRRRKLGFVFQDFNLLDSLTLKENVMLPLILDKKSASEMEEKAQEIMTLFGIYPLANKYPYNVSGGEQQRTAVARALANNPVLVLADEPTGNLDSKSSGIVMKCFEKINQEKNATILMVTHDSFAASFCKRIVFLKDGKIEMQITKKGDRKEFFHRILDCLSVLGGETNDLS